jgi:hypothetical protein
MLTQYGGLPAFEIMFDTGGHLVDPGAQAEAVAYFGSGDGKALTDLIVISHGWNNDIGEARALYGNFFNSWTATRAKSSLDAKRTFGVLAFFWPSKRFADADLISGGAAGVGTQADAVLYAQLDGFAQIFGSTADVTAKIAHLRALVPVLENNPTAQDDYVGTLVSMVPKPRYERDEGLDDARDHLDSASGHVVLQRLSTPFVPVTTLPISGSGGATSIGGLTPGSGNASGFLGGLLGGIKSAAANLGNVLTYYAMKDRSGIVGRTGAVAAVQAMQSARPGLTIHIVGHSFGGRLVTSLANALAASGQSVRSMSLLEAAYSHNGLASKWDGTNDGTFRDVVAKRSISGPILITHSVHDFPVGTCYPIASRMMNQAASALIGGPNDKYGGMGRNGAQHTPEAVDDTLHDVGTKYAAFADGTWIRNLKGDGPPPPSAPTVTGHGDVAKPEITWAIQEHI